nr:histidine phosphatase family protein [Oscillospiraceae bacterium]
MNKQTKIILIRHGQSIGNATRTILGHTDLDLSEHGYIQAQATANYLKEEKIDKIYSSDLKRAINTAIPHAEIRNINIVTNKNLRELYVGAWENMKVDDIILKWGREAYEKWIDSFGTFTFPNGESVCDGGQRFYKEVLSISNENLGKTILISAHAAVIRSFWAIISGVEWSQVANNLPFPSNASYSIAYSNGKTINPDIYSCDDHLIDVGITKVKLI